MEWYHFATSLLPLRLLGAEHPPFRHGRVLSDRARFQSVVRQCETRIEFRGLTAYDRDVFHSHLFSTDLHPLYEPLQRKLRDYRRCAGGLHVGARDHIFNDKCETMCVLGFFH